LLSDRAIVSDIPGTTRDFIEEAFQYDGILFRLIDTAGLRITIDEIEQKGIDRTRDQIKEADILVYIFDLTQNYNKSDWEIFREYMLSAEESKQEGIVVFNKSDLVKNESTVEFIRINTNEFRKIKNILHISANKEQDIEILRKNFTDLVKKNQDNIDDTRVVTNIRHRTALINTKYSLLKAIEAIAANESNEFIAVHLRKSLNSLGEITGIVTTEEILNNIFSKFCIGK
jgi:tRNA modification GTPase